MRLASFRDGPRISYGAILIGVNYVNRNAEYRDDSALPAHPSVFIRTPGSLVGHGQPIVLPPELDQLDYEGEIAIVIGTPTGAGIRHDPARFLAAGDRVEVKVSGVGTLANVVTREGGADGGQG